MGIVERGKESLDPLPESGGSAIGRVHHISVGEFYLQAVFNVGREFLDKEPVHNLTAVDLVKHLLIYLMIDVS